MHSYGKILRVCLHLADDESTLLINWLARQFKVAFESPKNEALSLFRHGELAYDHLILAPPKSKG